jgi:hypothetical protein
LEDRDRPDFEEKENRVLHLYGIADAKVKLKRGDPSVVFCMDEFGPLNLLPRPGRQWAPRIVKGAKPGAPRQRRRRATYKRTQGVRHLMAAYDLSQDKLYGHVKTEEGPHHLLGLLPLPGTLYPPSVRIGIALDNFSPHL